jgi:hypothetical protein
VIHRKEKAMPKITKSRISRTRKGYFHDLDPYTLHPTKQGAGKARAALSGSPFAKSRRPRVATFYTIMQDRRKNNPQKFGNVPQGPHTFPHFAIHLGIVEAKRQSNLAALGALIPDPVAYVKRVAQEIPATHQKGMRATLAGRIYKKRFKRFRGLEQIVHRSATDEIRYAHVINKLLQMDPHGSYAYKGTGASKSALKGKGESSDRPLKEQIDLPSTHGFSSSGLKAAKVRSQTLLAALKPLGIK